MNYLYKGEFEMSPILYDEITTRLVGISLFKVYFTEFVYSSKYHLVRRNTTIICKFYNFLVCI